MKPIKVANTYVVNIHVDVVLYTEHMTSRDSKSLDDCHKTFHDVLGKCNLKTNKLNKKSTS